MSVYGYYNDSRKVDVLKEHHWGGTRGEAGFELILQSCGSVALLVLFPVTAAEQSLAGFPVVPAQSQTSRCTTAGPYGADLPSLRSAISLLLAWGHHYPQSPPQPWYRAMQGSKGGPYPSTVSSPRLLGVRGHLWGLLFSRPVQEDSVLPRLP